MDQPYYPKYATAAAAAVDGTSGPVVVVGHSAAGALLPAIAEAVGDRTRGAVFVDAMLPQPGRSWFDTAPPGLEAQLRGLADHGLLPPWHEWFPPGSLEALVPDPAAEATSHRRDSATAGGVLRRARAARTIREIRGLRISAARPSLRPPRRTRPNGSAGGWPAGLGPPADAHRAGGGRRLIAQAISAIRVQVMAFWRCGASL